MAHHHFAVTSPHLRVYFASPSQPLHSSLTASYHFAASRSDFATHSPLSHLHLICIQSKMKRQISFNSQRIFTWFEDIWSVSSGGTVYVIIWNSAFVELYVLMGNLAHCGHGNVLLVLGLCLLCNWICLNRNHLLCFELKKSIYLLGTHIRSCILGPSSRDNKYGINVLFSNKLLS